MVRGLSNLFFNLQRPVGSDLTVPEVDGPRGLSYPELGPHLATPDLTLSDHNPDHAQRTEVGTGHGWPTYPLGALR